MRWIDVVWTAENLAHVADHRLTRAECEYIIRSATGVTPSRSSGRLIAFGVLPDGRLIGVVFERVDDITVYPVTAYEVKRS